MGTNARCSSSSSSSSSFLQAMYAAPPRVQSIMRARARHRRRRRRRRRCTQREEGMEAMCSSTAVQLLHATLTTTTTTTTTESLCFLPAILPLPCLHVIRRSENPQWAQRAPEIAISTARARHACRQEAGMCLVTRECHVTCVLCVDRGTKCDAAAVLRSLRARVPGIQD